MCVQSLTASHPNARAHAPQSPVLRGDPDGGYDAEDGSSAPTPASMASTGVQLEATPSPQPSPQPSPSPGMGSSYAGGTSLSFSPSGTPRGPKLVAAAAAASADASTAAAAPPTTADDQGTNTSQAVSFTSGAVGGVDGGAGGSARTPKEDAAGAAGAASAAASACTSPAPQFHDLGVQVGWARWNAACALVCCCVLGMPGRRAANRAPLESVLQLDFYFILNV